MIKGSKHTAESKMKSSLSHKGQIPWNYGRISKECSVCKTKFLVSPYRKKIAKFCSRKCKSEFQTGISPKNTKGLCLGHGWNKGRSIKINDALKIWRKNGGGVGEKNASWKGDEVGYHALHHWVNRHLGKPTKCEHCGKDGLRGKSIHWANKSGKYKRNLKDWLRLCVKCHMKYDAD